MKIGIYTFTAANNYGAVLQAFALKKYLCDNGYDAHCIDYRPSFLTERYTPFSFVNMKKKKGTFLLVVLKEFLRYPFQIKKNNLFEKFRTDYLSFIPHKGHDIDYFFVGSDQVWNYNLTRGDEVFLGKIPYSKGNVSSYAASMEVELKRSQENDFYKSLSNFVEISVRERYLKDIIEEKCKRQCDHVVDPTLLLSSSQWRLVSKPYKKYDNNYVFMYGFGFNKKDIQIVRSFAQSLKLKLIIATSGVNICGGYTNDISPNQFLYLIDHAKYIVTNSFHGTIFSIIFRKKLLEISHRTLKKNSRVEGLFQLLECSYVPYNLEDGIDINSFKIYPIDSIQFKQIINNSKLFLLKCLS